MPHRQLSAHLSVLILSTTLVKLCLRAKPVGCNLTEWDSQTYRQLLQTGTPIGLINDLEYDPALDDPQQLLALTAVYEATGGAYWSYQNHFTSSSTANMVATAPSPTQAAQQELLARFANRRWLDMSVSYCQWYASCHYVKRLK